MLKSKPPPLDKGGTIKNKNVQVLDLTYEEPTSPNLICNDLQDSPMTNAQGNIPDSQNQTISTAKNPLPKFFNVNTDKYYNDKNIYVYIEKNNEQNIGRLHPMYIGHILHKKLNIKNITTIEKVGFNRIKVGLKTIVDANNLIKNELLQQEDLKAFIPNNLLVRKGVIKFVDTRFDEDYLVDNIKSGCKILAVNRLKRKVINENQTTYVPRQIVVLTFEGNKLPNEVYINSVVCPVEPFIQRVVQCFKCLRFGHVSSQCRSNKPLCINCSQSIDVNHKCEDKDIFCYYCKNHYHKSISKECPYFQKQTQIKKHMSNLNLSYSEAKKYMEVSYSGVFPSNNRFELLNNLEDMDRNFPKLPTPTASTTQTFSQPPRPLISPSHTNKTPIKKRKINSPSLQSPQIPPLFPFVMGPSQPLPPNTRKTVDIGTDKEKILNVFTKFIHDIISKINSVNDLKQIDDQFLKGELSSVLDNLQIHG